MGNWLERLRGAEAGRAETRPPVQNARSADALARAEQCLREGRGLEEQRRLPEALDKYREAVRLYPAGAGIHVSIGNVLLEMNDADSAMASFREALQLKPDYAGGHYSAARACLALGRQAQAEQHFNAALAADPEFALAQEGRAAMLEQMGKWPEAIGSYEKLLALEPGSRNGLLGLARALSSSGRTDEAFRILERLLPVFPNDAEGWRFKGKLELDMGLCTEAVGSLRRAAQLNPDDPDYHGMLLFALNYLPDADRQAVLAEHADYDKRFCARYLAASFEHRNSPDPERRLRVGYISGDFREHVVTRFIEPLLAHHDPARIEVFCYHNHPAADAATARLKALAHHWRDVAKSSDDEMARAIGDDAIDILVDLSGHTERHRLGVFARKPAPVQATWLGYLNTTGLRAMDYRICDACTDPPGEGEAWVVERPARLPACQWCLPLASDLPAVAEPPLLRRGYPTFGSFNNLAKVNDSVLRLWGRILAAIPAARMLMVGVPPGRAAGRIAGIFAELGIAQERYELRPRCSREEYFRTHNEVDVALDPFPYNGGTTSLDALAMGVPFITLAGDRPAGRGGMSILTNIGLAELIASSPEDYVAIAKGLAADADRLSALRCGMRQRLESSPLGDIGKFARDLECLYREMWIAWCRQVKPDPARSPRAG